MLVQLVVVLVVAVAVVGGGGGGGEGGGGVGRLSNRNRGNYGASQWIGRWG
jgi:hypothetical protein